VLRNERHVIMEATRLDQFGFWEGVIRYDGRELVVEGHCTFGLKDRSSGIRPVGAPYTSGDKVGHGVLEQMHIGASTSYGFNDWFDGAS